MADLKSNEKSSRMMKVFKWVEKVGNKLPHPFTMFLWLLVIIIILSAVFGSMGVAVQHPVKDETVAIKSLLTKEGIQYIILNLVKNFSGFAPLGLVLSMMLGIGLAEQSGFMDAFMKRFILGAPEKLLVFMVFLIGICGNIASDAAAVVVPGLAGAIFYGAKKNPIVGIIAGYAAANAGFTANIIVAGTDVLLASITGETAKIINPAIEVSPLSNYYFMIVSTLVLAVVGTWLTSKVVIKIAGDYQAEDQVLDQTQDYEVTEEQRRGLKSAGLISIIFWGLVIAALIPTNSPLRGEGGSFISSPFIKGIVPFLLVWFVAVGVSYGRKVGTVTKSADVPRLMTKAIEGMSSYIVLVFVMAQFIGFFNWTNMGLVLSVKLADLLKASNFTGYGMVVAVIFITMFINLFIGSGSAKWALLAPVFVPMFMMLNYSPAFAQVAYRIGDSTTNAITPLSPYFAIALGFMQKYKKDIGVGNFFSLALPYVLGFGIIWIILLAIWFYLKLPLGPGAGIFM
ncbi:AbgT family transporter [Fusibacter paucivorans]|uniref:AbgT family transporter n=1 Tax=Fusibacter paucivorans TaxID=76009 RepID=A0ABS5PJP8_9FIRM|nr:AbgT family transporter [Fusibacter paucivorans]MBS7525369.1 AbgT family transporter [Fusibacter paucivorans]